MNHITEIIPDNPPKWFAEAMAKGQLFRTAIDKVETLENMNNSIRNNQSISNLRCVTTQALLDEIKYRLEPNTPRPPAKCLKEEND